jgi:hypothetical protein
LVYLDDIIIFRGTLQVYNEKLRDLFCRLRKHNLKLQPDRCEFLRKKVEFVGHVIMKDGDKPDEISQFLHAHGVK